MKRAKEDDAGSGGWVKVWWKLTFTLLAIHKHERAARNLDQSWLFFMNIRWGGGYLPSGAVIILSDVPRQSVGMLNIYTIKLYMSNLSQKISNQNLELIEWALVAGYLPTGTWVAWEIKYIPIPETAPSVIKGVSKVFRKKAMTTRHTDRKKTAHLKSRAARWINEIKCHGNKQMQRSL